MVPSECGTVSKPSALSTLIKPDELSSVRTGQAHRTLLGHTGPVTCLQFDEIHIVSGSLDKTVRASTFRVFVSVFPDGRTGLGPPIWRNIPNYQIRSCRDCIAVRHAKDSGSYRREWHQGRFRLLISIILDETWDKVYNRTSMQQSTLLTNGHTKPVERLRYMDRYLVSGGRDSTVKIWSL